uniref:Uncharacterized protein n=1 Tax=Picea glauca TaxID=3330 RepID=A0A117NIG6_PICGL|nr:hypothetical protein ABT39_MTgene3170 [Picea glauca]
MNLSTVHHRTLPLIALREYEGSFWVIESKYMWLTRNNITTICYHCYCSCSHCKREEELPEKILYVFLPRRFFMYSFTWLETLDQSLLPINTNSTNFTYLFFGAWHTT